MIVGDISGGLPSCFPQAGNTARRADRGTCTTLRTYDRLGLVSPRRSSGGGRRYSQHDVELLREVQRLSQDEGVNLAGIKRIIELTNQVEALQSRLKEMAAEIEVLRATQRRDIAVVPKSTAVVVWQPRR